MSQPASLSRRYLLWTELSVFLVAFFAFLNTLRNQFALDDYVHLVEDFKVRSLAAGISSLWVPMYPGNLFRPLVTISYALTYHFFGLNPLPYHLTNVLLHALNSLLVFRVILFFLPLRLSAFVAFAFAALPIHSEAVANISGRAELMAFFFGINTLILCVTLSRESVKQDSLSTVSKLISIVVSFLCALLCKESAISFLLLIPFMLAFFTHPALDLKRVLLCYAILIVAAEYYLYLRVHALGSLLGSGNEIDFLDNPLINMSFYERLPNVLAALGQYVALILLPLKLSSDYSFAQMVPLGPGFDLQAFEHVLLIIILLGLALIRGRFRRESFFFLLWFFLAFLVTSNLLFPIGTIFAERLSYLPSVGILALCVVNLEKLESNLMRNVLIVLFCSFCVLRTSLRNSDWHDNNTLHARDILNAPQSAKAQLNFGVVLKNRGELDLAEHYMRQALETYPNFSDAAYNLGLLEVARHHEQESEDWFLKALKLNANNTNALNLLGRISLKQGNLKEAAHYFSEIVKADPANFEGLLGILAISLNTGDLKTANSLYENLKARDPNNKELAALAAALKAPESKAAKN